MRTGIDLIARLAVPAVLAFVSADMAEAQTTQQVSACSSGTNATLDDQIAGCAAMIRSGKYSGKNLAIIFNNRCSAYYKKGNSDLAIDDCDRATKLDSSYALPYYNRAVINYQKADYDRTIREASEAIARDPKYRSAYTTRANAYSDKGDHDHAILDYNEALRIDPKDPLTLNNRCDEFALLGQFVAARLDCDESLKIRPHHKNTLKHRALVLLALAKFDDAQTDYADLVRQDSKDAGALYGQGVSKLKKGDVAGGNDDIASAKALDANVDKSFWRYGPVSEKR
jgi:tetratricopeptide (TPR) repeat protein